MSADESAPWKRALALLALCVFGFAVYSNSLRGEFVFDDMHTIVESPNVKSLTPLSRSFSGEAGSTVSGRPFPAFSLALNYAAGGLDVYGYHLVNVALHVLAALALFGLVRLTLANYASAALSKDATGVAFVCALLWLLHPLHTDALNHVSYRTETMMALFYLLALYAAARGFLAERTRKYAGERTQKASRTRARGWQAVAFFAAFYAMGSKEAAVSLPLIVLLYDRQFVSKSFAAAFRTHRSVYLQLLGTWAFLLLVIMSGDRGETVGFEVEQVSSLDYLRTQARGLWLYLGLSVWPRPLVFDYYGVEVVKSWGSVWLESLGIVALFAWTLRGVALRKAWSVPALAVFAVLAPSSSFIPLAGEVLAEHRMVLPLAGLISLVVVGVHRYAPRAALTLPVALAIAAGFATLTYQRNADYATQETIWSDTVAKRPNNARALNNLFKPLIERGAYDEAAAVLQRSLELRPGSVRALNNLGVLMTNREQWVEAEQAFKRSLAARPEHVNTHYNLAQLYARRERWAEALEHFQFVARETPLVARGHLGAGQALLRLGRQGEAVTALRAAIDADARTWPALRALAWIHSTSKDPALRDGPQALRLAEALCSSSRAALPHQQEVLASALAENGRFAEALEVSERAAQVARQAGDLALARSIRARAQFYARGEPYRE